MRVMHQLFSKPLHLTENTVGVITITRPELFRKFVHDIIGQTEGIEGELVLSQNFEPISCVESVNVIYDFYHTPQIKKKLQNKIDSMIQSIASNEMLKETNELFTQTVSYFEKLSFMLDFPTGFEHVMNIKQFIKAVDFSVCLDELEPVERIVEFISLCNELLKNQWFVLIGAKSFFSTDELKLIYDMAFARKVTLLLIEQNNMGRIENYESHILIDDDFCEIRLEKE